MKQTIKVYIHHRKYEWQDKAEYVAYPYIQDHSLETIFMFEHDFDVDIPDGFDPTPQKIALLRAQRTKILAEAQVKVNNLDQQIQELLCIENKVTA